MIPQQLYIKIIRLYASLAAAPSYYLGISHPQDLIPILIILLVILILLIILLIILIILILLIIIDLLNAAGNSFQKIFDIPWSMKFIV